MNSNTDKYNGWANYETWNYALWLDNERGSCEYWNEQAQEAFDNAEDSEFLKRKQNAADKLADSLKDYAENYAEQTMPSQSGWMADAVNSYLGEVDWYEIAEHYLADITEEEEASK